MQNISNTLRLRFALILAVVTTAAMACATDPVVGDYSAAAGQFKTDSGAMVTANGPLLLGALVTFLGFGFIWRFGKRAAKSV